MTQEHKDLLLKDLCARLPYKVKGLVTFNGNLFMSPIQVENRTIDGKLYDRFAVFQDSWYDNVTIKPYLFPLSSMTEKQIFEINEILGGDFEIDKYGITDLIRNRRTSLSYLELDALFEYFNKNHIDYRGLIPMGLANDATGKNIY